MRYGIRCTRVNCAPNQETTRLRNIELATFVWEVAGVTTDR